MNKNLTLFSAITTGLMMVSAMTASAADDPKSTATTRQPQRAGTSGRDSRNGQQPSAWRHFGDGQPAPVRNGGSSDTPGIPKRSIPGAATRNAPAREGVRSSAKTGVTVKAPASTPAPRRAVAPRINNAADDRPRATSAYYREPDVKARPVFAVKRGASDQAASVLEPVTAGMAREIEYGQHDIILVRTRLRYTTVIALPAAEQIMDFVIGDKDNWIVNGAANLAYIKPAKADAATNLNLVSTRGIIYSFMLAEVADGVPDLKLFVKPHDEEIELALRSPAKFVAVDRIDDYRQQAEIARTQARETQEAAKKAVENQVSAFKKAYPAKVHAGYRFDRNKKPFDVTDIFDDGKFTYIKAHPEETPTLYEVKDGKPNLVNFEFNDGTYVVAKVLDSGYLAIGKRRFVFTREH